MPLRQREQLEKIVTEARKRVIYFYGDCDSDPQILACSTERCFCDLGGRTQRGIDLGKSKILLSPRGLTAPILAHEWSHAELSTRMDARMDGVFGIPSIPTWFNEGLAVVVSGEPTESEKVWKIILAKKMATPKLKNLVSLQGWNKAVQKFGDLDRARGNTEKMYVVYTTAGHEVREWYERVGKKGLLSLIEKIKSGEKFKKAYGNYQVNIN